MRSEGAFFFFYIGTVVRIVSVFGAGTTGFFVMSQLFFPSFFFLPSLFFLHCMSGGTGLSGCIGMHMASPARESETHISSACVRDRRLRGTWRDAIPDVFTQRGKLVKLVIACERALSLHCDVWVGGCLSLQETTVAWRTSPPSR